MERAVARLTGFSRPLRLLPRREWGSLLTWLLGAALLGYLAWYYSGWASGWRTAVTDFAYLPLGLGAVSLAWRAAAHPALDRRSRRAWRLLAAALATQLGANATWFWIENIRHQTPFPSLADIGYLAFIPIMLAGLLAFPGRPRSTRERFKLALDACTVVAGGFMLLWYLVLGPTVASHGPGPLTAAISTAYPVGDLVLLFGVVTVLLRGPAPSSRPSLRLLVAGLVALMIADVDYGYIGLHQRFVGGSWPDLFWLSSLWLMAAAANDRASRASLVVTGGDDRAAQRPSALPYLGIALGYGLLLALAGHLALYPLGGLLIGSVALTTLVVARQLVALRENAELIREQQHLAVTDSLTGLGNRRQFFDLAEREFQRASRYGRPLAVVMIDVDHFKQANDTHGHAAGDTVLRTVAERCGEVLRHTDLLCRYGGDELVVLLPENDAAGALATAERLREAVVGRPVATGAGAIRVSLSLGVADSSTCGDLPMLLHRADAALYEAKRRGRDQAASWCA